MIRIACQVPASHCNAPLTDVNNNLLGQGRPRKLHSTHEEAFGCHARFLVAVGYERVGGREFRPPGGGAIMVLNKQTHYGTVFRTGKTPQGKGGKRFMPKSHRKHCRNGVILG
jgi:hypothetical protein